MHFAVGRSVDEIPNCCCIHPPLNHQRCDSTHPSKQDPEISMPGNVWRGNSRVSLVAVGKGDKREGALSDRRIGLRAVDVHRQDLAVCFTNSPQIFGIPRALCLEKHPFTSEGIMRLLVRSNRNATAIMNGTHVAFPAVS